MGTTVKTPYQRRPFTFDRVVRLIISIAAIVFGAWLIYYLRGVLLPFLVACLLAYIFEPIVQWNRQILRLRGRIIAALCTIFEITFLLSVLAYFCIPSIIEESGQMAYLLKKYLAEGSHTPLLPDFMHKYIRENLDITALTEKWAAQDMNKIVQKSISIVSGGISFLLSILDWLLTFIYLLFIMLDYDNLMRGFKLMVPPRYRIQVFRVWRDVKVSMNHYFRGQALIALIIAVSYSIGFSIIGIPLAVVIGLSIGVLFMVPYLQYITLIPVTLLCIVYSVDSNVDFWQVWWECMALYAINEVLADLVLTPRIMGKAMGMNPAIILLSLSVWGSLMGIIGMLIALPMTTLLISYYNNYLIKHETARQRASQPSFLEDMSEGPMIGGK